MHDCTLTPHDPKQVSQCRRRWLAQRQDSGGSFEGTPVGKARSQLAPRQLGALEFAGWKDVNGDVDSTNPILTVTLARGGALPQSMIGVFVVHPVWDLAGDANGDGAVNFADLLILAQNYGKTAATFSDGDFDADGTVGFDDLLILAQNYGKSIATTAADPAGTPADALLATRKHARSARARFQ